MALYEFCCERCIKSPMVKMVEGDSEVHLDAVFTKDFPMKSAPPIGKPIKCPVCDRKTAKRIFSSGVVGIIKGKSIVDWKPNESMRTNINGQDVRFTFVDHPHTDPELQRRLGNLARQEGIRDTGGLNNARFDPKSGRTVVDVVSNVPDPLGKLEKSKKSGEYTSETRKVNTPYRRRKGKRS